MVQPYQKNSHNIIDTLIMLTSSVMTASLTTKIATIEHQHSQSYAAHVLISLSIVIPLLYLTAILLHWVYRSGVLGLLCRMRNRCRQMNICCTGGRQRREGTLELSGSLPDRIVNPDEYLLLEEAVGQCDEQRTTSYNDTPL